MAGRPIQVWVGDAWQCFGPDSVVYQHIATFLGKAGGLNVS